MQEHAAQCVWEAQAQLGEGPCWWDEGGELLWVDITSRTVNAFHPRNKRNRTWTVPTEVGFAIPTTTGKILAGTRSGFIRLDTHDGHVEPLIDPESKIPENRFNDGKCDALGRVWAGTISDRRIPGAASLYVLDQNELVHRALSGLTNSNGLAWSADQKTFYHIDTPTRRVDAFDFHLDRAIITNRRTVIRIPESMGKPDGMTLDSEGMLWIALWGGSAVTRWDPSRGELLARVDLPVTQVTSCCFGGAQYGQLFITTARQGLTAAQLANQPLAGNLFVTEPGVPGLAPHYFAG